MMAAISVYSVSLVLLFMSFKLSLSVRYDYPFQDPSLAWDTRVDDLVGRLTLEELVPQSFTRYGHTNPGIPRLGIKPYTWISECLRGLRGTNVTAFLQSLGQAASFSPELVYNVSQAVAIEVRAQWNGYSSQGIYKTGIGLNCFSPVINILRHPLWGRNQETYGEDPYMSGQIAASNVQGLQGNHPRYAIATATCKHFDVHGGPENIPESRFSFNAKVSTRDWRMTYLPAFKTCIEAGVYSLMCSYNRINGIPACANGEILTNVSRNEWGFKGFVVSDAGAIENIVKYHHYLKNETSTTAACIQAGCNLELESEYFNSTPKAIDEGLMTESEFRESMKKVFYPRFRQGEFDPTSMNPYAQITMDVIQSVEHRELAIQAAAKSFVLLKNNKDFLPIKPTFGKVAIVGPLISDIEQLYGDYASDVMKQFAQTPLEGLASLGKTHTNATGCNDPACKDYDRSKVKDAVTGTDLVIVCLGTGQGLESEAKDRKDIDLPGRQLDLLKDAANYANGKPVILLLFNAGPLDITWAKLDSGVTAILECFFPAQATGAALFRVLTATGQGSIPAARLPMTWPAYLNQVPSITNYSMQGHTYRYYEGEPLYPFGYGLSYSTFDYKKITVSPTKIEAGENVTVQVTLQNQGPLDAEEVVQVYMTWDNSSLPAPKLQLVRFTRVAIKNQDTVTLTLTITAEQMALWMDDTTGFSVVPGPMSLYAGGQQPLQRTTVKSNVLSAHFDILDNKSP